MSELIQASAPIIPVIDERLAYLPTAPREHKAKVEQYNELLEDIYQREVELSRIKSALVDMRDEIAEEARHLDGTSVLPRDAAAALEAAKSESESDEAENVLSDSSGSSADKARKNPNSIGKPSSAAKKTKGKFGRLGNRHSKVPDAQLDAEWDYKLELGRGGKKGRRGSEASETDMRV